MKPHVAVRGRLAVAAQKAYYEDTAGEFDAWHLKTSDEHHSALLWIDFLFPPHMVASVLDVGAGTGRTVQFFRHRGRSVTGVEPSSAQIAQARKKGIPPGHIVQADGRALPFADGSFDAVCEFGVLHHVEQPQRVIAEMLRVARKAVFISDSNRFGQGHLISKLAKLALCNSGLWRVAELTLTRGKGYHFSERDGIFYSFSVYDHLEQVARAAEHVWLLPVTKGNGRLWCRPLLTHGHVLLCAFKKGFAPPLGMQMS